MKKILIVSPYFAPENSIASVRFTKIAKYLQSMGHDVTIICTQMDANIVIDGTLEKDLHLFKKIIRINYPEILYYKIKARLGVENAKNSPEQVNNKSKEIGHAKHKENLVWAYVHLCSVLLGRRYIRHIKKTKEIYDVVITTFSPMSAHMLGHYMKKKGLCFTWIADFRDPLTLHCPKSSVSNFIQKQGARLVKNADYITAVSEGCKDMLIDEMRPYGVDITDKIRVISNGYDTADREALLNVDSTDGKLVFSYCGTIYSIDGERKSDISPLFRALSALIRRNVIDKNKVVIEYAGRDGGTLEQIAEEYHLKDIVCCHGKVSRDESLRLQRQSDVVLALIWNNKGETGILSGKFFETLLVQRNVLCLVNGNLPGSELASIIRKMQCGFAYEEINGDKSQMPKLEKWILNCYKEKMDNKELVYDSLNGEPYSHQALAKKFECLF